MSPTTSIPVFRISVVIEVTRQFQFWDSCWCHRGGQNSTAVMQITGTKVRDEGSRCAMVCLTPVAQIVVLFAQEILTLFGCQQPTGGASCRLEEALHFRLQIQISSPTGQKCGKMACIGTGCLGVCMSYRNACLIFLLISSTATLAQVSH